VRRQSHRTIHFLHIAVIIDRAALSKEKSSSQMRIDGQPAKTGGFQGRIANRVDLRQFPILNPPAFAQGEKDGRNWPDSRFQRWFYSSIIASTRCNLNAGKSFPLIRQHFMQLRGLR